MWRYMRLFYFLIVLIFLVVTIPLMILFSKNKIIRGGEKVSSTVNKLYPDELILQISQAS
jgi:hypothetical protein